MLLVSERSQHRFFVSLAAGRRSCFRIGFCLWLKPSKSIKKRRPETSGTKGSQKNRARQASPYESESKLSHSKFLSGVWLAFG
jgi:hypothetical protein